jgi:surfeit locus 1 family protein
MMSPMRFRPTFWPTVFTIPAIALMLGLGIWQLDRLAWKTGLIAEIQSRLAAPPAPLDAVLAEAGGDPDRVQFRRVRLTGEFLNEREMYLAARSMNGNPGYHLMTPFRETSGAVVLVDRGWVPVERKLPGQRAEGQLEGERIIEGVIRVPRPEKAWFQPDNEPEQNMWYWVDLPALRAHAGIKGAGAGEPTGDAAAVYVEAGPAANPGGFPIGGQTRVNLPNDHLQYAITWFALAVILAVIYVIYHRRPRDTTTAG